jgi:hypothetical protein
VPIKIDFLADASRFLRGTKDVEGALDQVAGSLDDVARDSSKMSDKLDDGAKDGERSVDRLNATFRELAAAGRDEGRKAGQGLGDGVRDGTRRAEEGVNNLKDEAKQSARESAASFRGGFDDIAGLAQEVAANAFAGFGPAGVAAGLGAAAGLGIAFSAIEKGNEQSEAYRQKVSELTDEFIDAGGVGKRSFDGINNELRSLATETDDSKTNLKDLRDIAEQLGTPLAEVARAYLEGGKPLDELIAKNKQLMQAENDRLNAATLASGEMAAAYSPELKALEDRKSLLEQQKRALAEAQAAELDYLAAGATEYEVKRGQIEALNDAYDETAASAEDYVNKESGLFDTQAYIDAMNTRAQALRDYQTTLASSALSDDAKAFLNDQGIDAAAQFMAGYKDATPAQQAELNRIWSEAGKQNSGSYAGALQQNMPATINGPRVVVNMDTRYYDDFVRNASKGVTLPVSARVLERGGSYVP